MLLEEFTRPSAAGCIIIAEDTGRWCLQQRSDYVSDPGVWSTWGGGVEAGETLEDAVCRELAEEGGYHGPVRLKHVHTSPRYATYIAFVPNEFEPKINYESKDWCWCEADQLPEPLHPGLAESLKKLSLNENTTQHQAQDLQDVAEWLNTTPDQLSIEVRQEPIEKFIKQIREMYGTYDEFPEDEERTNRILKLLKRGAKPLPIYVEAGDPHLFVMEGRHRMVAFWLAGMKSIPVAYASKKVEENFNDGKKPGRKGLSKRVGVNCKQSVSKLRSIAKNSSGERQRMAHWCANMKSGRNKNK